jgi:hypothetical protein
MAKKKNTLQIRAQALDLELTGDATYVEQAYMAMRHVVIERFRATLEEERNEADQATTSLVQGTTVEAKAPASPSVASEMEAAEAGQPAPALGEREDTNPMSKAIRDEFPPNIPDTTLDAVDTPLHTVIVGDVYHSVSIAARRELDQSIFGRVLNARFIARIYVNRADRERLKAQITVGTILWRELTTVGPSAIAKRGGQR